MYSLVKNVVGAGIFALPAGAASGAGLVPSMALTIIMGLISGWTFFVLGRASAETGSNTYPQLWERTVGSEWVGVINAGLVAMAFGERERVALS